jgi:hypothetical protein
LKYVEFSMNIETEEGPIIIAKTSGNTTQGKKISYSFAEPEHALSLDKKDVLIAEIEACERLLKYASESTEREAIEKELSELRMTLDLLS